VTLYLVNRFIRVADSLSTAKKQGCDTLAIIAMKPEKSTASKRALDGDSGHRMTLRKLAEHLGLSRTTISMILNDVPEATRFPEETRRRVAESAKKFGYRPNYFARSLGRKRSYLIGVIASDFGNGYDAALLGGFERHLLNTGYTSFISNHFWSPSLLQRHVETLCDRGAEGLLLIDSTPSQSPGIPAVAICTSRSPVWSTRVSIDNTFGVRESIIHLSHLGHKEIAFIKGPEGSGDTNARWDAVLAVCQDLGVRVDPRLTIQLERLEPTGTSNPEEGRIATQKLLDRGRRFTALATYNDISAFGAMAALREAGCRVPEDVSVIGFDDIEFASISYPPLTTIRQPLREMGATAAEVLIRKIEKNEAVEDISVRPELVVRSSTCPPSRDHAKSSGKATQPTAKDRSKKRTPR
jgi:DNA-binding LacI/PurR family transcriptional regulator